MNKSLHDELSTELSTELCDAFADVVSAGGPINNSRSGDLRRSIEQRRSKSRRTLGVFGGATLAASLVAGVATYSVIQSDRRSTDESVLVGVTPRTPLQTAGLIAGWLPEGTFQLRAQSLSGADPGFEERALFGSPDDGLEIVRFRSPGSVDPDDETDPFEIAPDIPDPDRPQTSESSGQLPDGSLYRWFEGPNELQSDRYLVRAIGRDRSLYELVSVITGLDGASIPTATLGLDEVDRETRPADRWPDSYVWEYTDDTDDGYAYLLRPSTYELKRQSWLRQTHVKQDEEIRGRSHTRSPNGTLYTVSGEEPTGHRLTGLFLHTPQPDVVRLLNELRLATDEEWKDQMWDPADPLVDSPPATAPPPAPGPYIATDVPPELTPGRTQPYLSTPLPTWTGFGTPENGLMVTSSQSWVPTEPGQMVDGVLVKRWKQPAEVRVVEAGLIAVATNRTDIDEDRLQKLAANLSGLVGPSWFDLATTNAEADQLVLSRTGLARTADYRSERKTTVIGYWEAANRACGAEVTSRNRDTEAEAEAWLKMLGRDNTYGFGWAKEFGPVVVRELSQDQLLIVRCFGHGAEAAANQIAKGIRPNPDYKP
jgi:hypothetical protein